MFTNSGVGDTVIILDDREKEKKDIILKMGRKWFEVSHGQKFSVADGKPHSTYCYPVAMTVAAFEKMKADQVITKKLRDFGIEVRRRDETIQIVYDAVKHLIGDEK